MKRKSDLLTLSGNINCFNDVIERNGYVLSMTINHVEKHIMPYLSGKNNISTLFRSTKRPSAVLLKYYCPFYVPEITKEILQDQEIRVIGNDSK
jgi:hypothetical protein